MTISDDVSALMAEYVREKKTIETDATELTNPEYKSAVMDEIRESKAKNAVAGGIPQQRAADFASLNYLLGYTAADVPANAYGLPTDAPKPASSEPGNGGDIPSADSKSKKIKLFKLKAKAILILQEQELERSYAFSQAA